jgi:hypothetical protein
MAHKHTEVVRTVQNWCKVNGIKESGQALERHSPRSMVTVEIWAGRTYWSRTGDEAEVYEAAIEAFQVEEQNA